MVAPVLGLICLGSILRRIGWLGAEADASLLKLTVNLLYPSLIFITCASRPALTAWGPMLWGPALGFFTVLLGFGVAAAVVRLLPTTSAPKARTFIFTVGIFNYGYIPVPLVEAFYPQQLGTLFLFNLGVDVAIWTVGIAILSGTGAGFSWRRLLNPSILAVLAGTAVNVAGWWDSIPIPLSGTLRMLSVCTVPLALMMIGATLLDEIRSGSMRADWRLGVLACLLRLGVLPVLFLALAYYLPLDSDLKQIVSVQAAMPAAVLPIVLARHYQGDARTAIWVVAGTTTLGLFLIPLWLGVGMGFLGLSE